MSLSADDVKKLTAEGVLSPDAANDKDLQVKQIENYMRANNIPITVKLPSSGLKTLGEGALSGVSNLGAGLYNTLLADPIEGIDKGLESLGFSKQARLPKMTAYQVPKEDVDHHPFASIGGQILPMMATPELAPEEAGTLLSNKAGDHLGGLLASRLIDKHNPAHLGLLSAIYGQGNPNDHNFFTDLMLGGALGKGAEAGGEKLTGMLKNYGSIISNRMLKGMKPAEIPAHVSDTIRDLYANKKKAIDGFYGNVLKQAEDRGYSEKSGGNPLKLPALSGVSSKYKIESPFTSQDLSGLIENKEIDSQLQKRISDFTKNPTFKNSHSLQSLLAREGNKLMTSPLGEQRALGGRIAQHGNALRQNIYSKLATNGDNDIADLYQDASNLYRDELLPYHHSRIWKLIKDKKFNPRPANLLKNDHEDILKILEDMDDDDRNKVAYDLFRNNTKIRNGKPEITDLSKIQKMLDNPQYAHFFDHGNTRDTLEEDISRNDRRNILLNHIIAGGGLHALGLSSLDTLLATPLAAKLNVVGKLGKTAQKISDKTSKPVKGLQKLLPEKLKDKKAPTRKAANALAALLIGGS